jgi:TolB-like protein/Tfp pilus assembly protein PilF
MSVTNDEPRPGPPADGATRGRRLDSWKEIAVYLGRDVRTVQRWEARDELPVRRLQHSKIGSVFAYTAELDAWRDARDPGKADRPADAGVAAGHAPESRRRVWTGAAIAAAIAVVAAGLVVYVIRGGAPAHGPVRSLAVLPLADLSASHDQAYFADGMTEALIARLSTARDLRVISRTSVMQFRDAQSSAREIAKALNVDAVIEGSVLRAGDRVRITARLIQGDTQQTVWSGTYDRQLQDVLTLQSDVARAILSEVQASVSPPPAAAASDRHQVAAETYETYLKARFHLNKRNRTPSDVAESIRLFEATTARDPTFAGAHAGLAAAYQTSGQTSTGVLPAVETIPKAAAAATRALELDPQLAEAHTVLALGTAQAWHWADAENHYRRAIAVDPNDASALLGLGELLLHRGRTEEGLAFAQRGRELDPLSPGRTVTLAWLLYHARRYDDAIRELRTVLAADPDSVYALWFLGFALIEVGDDDAAIRTLERASSVWNRNPAALGVLARAYGNAGRRADAARIVGELQQREREGYVAPAVFVHAYLGTGDHDRALDSLERAYQERSNIIGLLKTHPIFDPIRNDARFVEIARRVGLH